MSLHTYMHALFFYIIQVKSLTAMQLMWAFYLKSSKIKCYRLEILLVFRVAKRSVFTRVNCVHP